MHLDHVDELVVFAQAIERLGLSRLAARWTLDDHAGHLRSLLTRFDVTAAGTNSRTIVDYDQTLVGSRDHTL